MFPKICKFQRIVLSLSPNILNSILLMPDIKNKIAYIIAVVNEFATRFSLNSQQAYRYLDRFKGIDFVDEFYGVEHTQSFEDVVDDLALYCHKNGGSLI